MNSDTNITNRTVFKAVSLFGGVQFIRMLAGVIQTKVVAVFVGVEGIGVLSLLKSIVAIVESVCSVGLNLTAVREFTIASKSEDSAKLPHTYKTLFVWSIASGFLGFLIAILFAPFLSLWTFGNYDYTFYVASLSLSLLFNSLATFYNSALQGLRLLRYLAISAVISTVLSVFFSVFLLYFFHAIGIVFSIVLSSFITMIFSLYFASKYKFTPIRLSLLKVWSDGSVMVKYGLLITISGLITTLILYLLKIYVAQNGGIDVSGLYQAGSTIFEGYFSVIFVAMATDYYPRLTTYSEDNDKMAILVNQQAQMNLLILLPILLVFIPFVPLIVTLLFSTSFFAIIPYVYCAIFGLVFKSASWSMGYILFAKGNSKQLLINSIVFNVFFFTIHVILFRFYGLIGLGLAYTAYFLIHFVGVLIITKKLYHFRFTCNFYLTLFMVLCFTIIAVLVSVFIKTALVYLIVFTLFVTSIAILIYKVRERSEF